MTVSEGASNLATTSPSKSSRKSPSSFLISPFSTRFSPTYDISGIVPTTTRAAGMMRRSAGSPMRVYVSSFRLFVRVFISAYTFPSRGEVYSPEALARLWSDGTSSLYIERLDEAYVLRIDDKDAISPYLVATTIVSPSPRVPLSASATSQHAKNITGFSLLRTLYVSSIDAIFSVPSNA